MKNYFKLLPLLAGLFLISCGGSGDQSDEAADTTAIAKVDTVELVKIWQTDTTLITSESACFDADSNIVFVSNIGAVPPDAKDNDGSIAKIDLEGNVLDSAWVTGLSAPKGMGLSGGYLYVTDIADLVKIKVETGEVEQKYAVDSAQFLNDVTIDENGDVYFSDSNTGEIWVLKNDTVSLFKKIVDFETNGLLVEKDRILAVSFSTGDFVAIDKETKEQTVLAKGIAGGDGIVAIEQGYLVSSWNGEIYFVSNKEDASAIKILDTKEEKINAADIWVVPEKNILLVPTFFGNSVTAYQINVK